MIKYMMEELNIPCWNNTSHFTVRSVIDDIKIKNPKIVNFIAFEEYQFFIKTYSFCDFFNTSHQDFFIENNIRANFFLGIFNSNDYKDYYHYPDKNIFLYTDPTFQFRLCFKEYCSLIYRSVNYNTFKYNIMSLMNRTRIHRCFLIDQLESRNLILNNAITWHRPKKPGYKFEHFDPKRILKLPNEPINFSTWNQWQIPHEWHYSFLHIVSESCTDLIFVTEKTIGPLLGAKLFICQAAKGFHRALKTLGFQLYDELIDYSFDNLEDVNERTNSMLNEVEKLIQLDHSYAYSLIHDKLKYNQTHAIKLALSDPDPSIPKSVIEFYRNKYNFY